MCQSARRKAETVMMRRTPPASPAASWPSTLTTDPSLQPRQVELTLPDSDNSTVSSHIVASESGLGCARMSVSQTRRPVGRSQTFAHSTSPERSLAGALQTQELPHKATSATAEIEEFKSRASRAFRPDADILSLSSCIPSVIAHRRPPGRPPQRAGRRTPASRLGACRGATTTPFPRIALPTQPAVSGVVASSRRRSARSALSRPQLSEHKQSRRPFSLY